MQPVIDLPGLDLREDGVAGEHDALGAHAVFESYGGTQLLGVLLHIVAIGALDHNSDCFSQRIDLDLPGAVMIAVHAAARDNVTVVAYDEAGEAFARAFAARPDWGRLGL